jgi:hypothetical protein
MKFPSSAGLGNQAAFNALPDGGVMVMGARMMFENGGSIAL